MIRRIESASSLSTTPPIRPWKAHVAEDQGEADRHHGADDDHDRSPHPRQVATFLVDRGEATDRALQAEEAHGRPESDDRQCQREGAVLRLVEVADDQDLGQEIEAEPDHPAHEEQAGSADLLDVRGTARVGRGEFCVRVEGWRDPLGLVRARGHAPSVTPRWSARRSDRRPCPLAAADDTGRAPRLCRGCQSSDIPRTKNGMMMVLVLT